jgi:hypothetical protein
LQSGAGLSERQAAAAEILSDAMAMDEQVIMLHEKFESLQRFEVAFAYLTSHHLKQNACLRGIIIGISYIRLCHCSVPTNVHREIRSSRQTCQ